MNLSRTLLAPLLASALLVGCAGTSGGSTSTSSSGSSGGSTTGGGTSGSTGSTGGSSGGSTGGACNTLANVGTAVTETADPGPVPVMTGGALTDGTYVLTAEVEYAGSGASSTSHKRTIAVSGSTIELVNSDNGGPDVRVTLHTAPSGSELNETAACPVGFSITPSSYTATATTLLLRKHGDNQVATYTRQ